MPVLVHGLVETQLAFRDSQIEMVRELREGLRRAAEPVRVDWQRLAVGSIRNMTIPWSQARTGAKASVVWVAPVKRGTPFPNKQRKEFATLLLKRAGEPALARNIDKVASEADKAISDTIKKWEAV